MAGRTVLLCTGPRCRKALARDDRLEATVTRLGVEITRVPCQKICKGPLVGVAIDGTWQWFGRMDSRKALEAFETLIVDDRLGKPLKKRRDKKRAGKRRS